VDVIHLDLYEISADEKITVEVPVHLTGIPDGVRNSGGVLDHLRMYGADRIALGTDYPFPLGEQRVGTLVRDMQGLGDGARAKLLAGNARRFLELA